MPIYAKIIELSLLQCLKLIAPTIAILLIVGIVVSLVQSTFKIEDPTLGLIGKLLVMIAVSIIGGVGLLGGFEIFTEGCIQGAPLLVRQSWS
ncbi:MAG TPA: flagellar biosynthetic protein FliQ [Acidocella sp.]|nr:flagellar biosynthetic protein FliQ [Acidocella sp.]